MIHEGYRSEEDFYNHAKRCRTEGCESLQWRGGVCKKCHAHITYLKRKARKAAATSAEPRSR